MPRSFAFLLWPVCVSVISGCAAPTQVVFEVVDVSGRPVAGAHARIILLNAGAPLPLSRNALEEVAALTEPTGGFTDQSGRVVLPVMGEREHLIEVEGPVLANDGLESSKASVWVYRPAQGSIVRSGQSESGLRVRPVE